MANSLRLGVNIDHVATIRNARGGTFPDPLRAALLALPRCASTSTLRRLPACDADTRAIRRASPRGRASRRDCTAPQNRPGGEILVTCLLAPPGAARVRRADERAAAHRRLRYARCTARARAAGACASREPPLSPLTAGGGCSCTQATWTRLSAPLLARPSWVRRKATSACAEQTGLPLQRCGPRGHRRATNSARECDPPPPPTARAQSPASRSPLRSRSSRASRRRRALPRSPGRAPQAASQLAVWTAPTAGRDPGARQGVVRQEAPPAEEVGEQRLRYGASHAKRASLSQVSNTATLPTGCVPPRQLLRCRPPRRNTHARGGAAARRRAQLSLREAAPQPQRAPPCRVSKRLPSRGHAGASRGGVSHATAAPARAQSHRQERCGRETAGAPRPEPPLRR